MAIKLLNVRCCCTPEKVLGTMPWREGSESMHFASKASLFDPPKKVTVRVRHFMHADGFNELAVYGDDRGVEFWRTIPGFREGDHVDPRA
jgi:hypothetical protein